MEFGRYSEEIRGFVSLKAHAPIERQQDGMLNDNSFLQPENRSSLISVKDSGRLIFSRFLHDENADSPIDATLLGIEISLKSQKLKAEAPIKVRV